MTKNVYRFSGNFKSFLFVLAILITFGFLYYTQLLVGDLQQQTREFQKLRVAIFEENINAEDAGDINFFFREIIQNTDYPIIYTDQDSRPQFWKNIGIPQSNSLQAHPDTIQLVQQLVREYRDLNPPIPIRFQENLLGYCYYGESAVIQQLRWLPYIQIAVVAMFILIGYAGFNSIKKSEERSIWVGMAKETAHQLGTPLSSQIGWLEYLKSSPEAIEKVIPELSKDLERLQVITNRFSQIGSVPDIQPEDLDGLIQDSTTYFRNRIPQKNGKTKIIANCDPQIGNVPLNRDLFSWVLENLVKNALDAMENRGGTVTITATRNGEQEIYIDIADSGKGISAANRKSVFKPGFSTKKRGWGLGLSLAKRIVEDYHGGRLILKESQVGKGSTFRIILDCP